MPITIFRPSIVLGDSRYRGNHAVRYGEGVCVSGGLAGAAVSAEDKIDIVNVDFVADAIATLHQKEKPQYDTYHLSSGTDSQTFRELTDALAAAQNKRGPIFCHFLRSRSCRSVNFLADRKSSLGHGAR